MREGLRLKVSILSHFSDTIVRIIQTDVRKELRRLDYKEMIVRMLDMVDERTVKIIYELLIKRIKASR